MSLLPGVKENDGRSGIPAATLLWPYRWHRLLSGVSASNPRRCAGRLTTGYTPVPPVPSSHYLAQLPPSWGSHADSHDIFPNASSNPNKTSKAPAICEMIWA